MHKELVEMLYRLGINRDNQRSFAASNNTSVDNSNYDQLCANTIRKIMIQSLSGINNTNNQSLGRNSYAASEKAAPPRANVTRSKLLLNFVLGNGTLR